MSVNNHEIPHPMSYEIPILLFHQWKSRLFNHSFRCLLLPQVWKCFPPIMSYDTCNWILLYTSMEMSISQTIRVLLTCYTQSYSYYIACQCLAIFGFDGIVVVSCPPPPPPPHTHTSPPPPPPPPPHTHTHTHTHTCEIP